MARHKQINTARKGDRLAYAVINELVAQGFTVLKGAASKSYPKGSGIDAIAIKQSSRFAGAVPCFVLQFKNVHISVREKHKIEGSLRKYEGYAYLKSVCLTPNWKEELAKLIGTGAPEAAP